MTTSRFGTFKRATLALAVLISLGASASAAEPADPPAEPKPAETKPAEAKPAKTKPAEKKQFDNPIRKVSSMMKKASKLLGANETGAPTLEEQKKILAELDRLIKMCEKPSSSSSSSRKPKPGKKQGQPKNTQQQPKNAKAGSKSGSPGTSPAPNESDVLGSAKTHLGDGAPDLKAIWGKLPDAPRDDVMQLLREKLPMKYKQLLILYFKALSENK